MDISISTRHGDLPSSTQEHIEEKAQKLPRFFDRVTSIEVTVDLKNHQDPEVEIKVSAEHLADVIAKAGGSNVIAATDAAIHKIERQLVKHKEKITGHRNISHKHLETETED